MGLRAQCIAGLVAVTMGGWAGTAHAITLTATYTGWISESFDELGLLGTAGSSLDGETFVLEFIYETQPGNFGYQSGAGYEAIYGGPGSHGGDSPVLSTAFTVNGNTMMLFGSDISDVTALNDGTRGEIAHSTTDTLNNAMFSIFHQITASAWSEATPGLFPAELDTIIPLTSMGTDPTGTGTFVFSMCQYVGNLCSSTIINAYGTLNFTSIEIAGDAVPAVPVPAALPLLLGGLGGLWLASRRRMAA